MGIHHFLTRKNVWIPRSAIGAIGLSILFDTEGAYKIPPRQFSIDLFHQNSYSFGMGNRNPAVNENFLSQKLCFKPVLIKCHSGNTNEMEDRPLPRPPASRPSWSGTG
jgi:hypothetical protein